ncbi:MAG: phage holin family protein [Gallionellaceae bacterium]
MPEADLGLLGSIKRLAASLTSLVSTRLELLANELQEERLRLTQMFFYALFAVFCFGMGMLLLSIFIVVYFWDTHRLAALATLCLIYFALASSVTVVLRNKSKQTSTLFSASLAELAKDSKQLDPNRE